MNKKIEIERILNQENTKSKRVLYHHLVKRSHGKNDRIKRRDEQKKRGIHFLFPSADANLDLVRHHHSCSCWLFAVLVHCLATFSFLDVISCTISQGMTCYPFVSPKNNRDQCFNSVTCSLLGFESEG